MRRMTAALSILAGVALPALVSAQSYKVEKYNIGGEGGTDYLTSDPATGRVFISRATHVMVVDAATGKVIGDIPVPAESPRDTKPYSHPKYWAAFILIGDPD